MENDQKDNPNPTRYMNLRIRKLKEEEICSHLKQDNFSGESDDHTHPETQDSDSNEGDSSEESRLPGDGESNEESDEEVSAQNVDANLDQNWFQNQELHMLFGYGIGIGAFLIIGVATFHKVLDKILDLLN